MSYQDELGVFHHDTALYGTELPVVVNIVDLQKQTKELSARIAVLEVSMEIIKRKLFTTG